MGVSGDIQINNNKRKDNYQSEIKKKINDEGMINNNPITELPDSI